MNPKLKIDLNADLGEHPDTDVDKQIMPYISSCNIACGGHIGDEASVRKTVEWARKYGVAVGAHPSYPDPQNFGREYMTISEDTLISSLKEQIKLVMDACKKQGMDMHHVKPHGALYNKVATDRNMALLIHTVLMELDVKAGWMGLAHSVTEEVAKEKGYPFISEGFADRQYEPDRTLRSRAKEGAMLCGKEAIGQVDALVFKKQIFAGQWIPISVQSICLHGDTPYALSLAKDIHTYLVKKGVHIATV